MLTVLLLVAAAGAPALPPYRPVRVVPPQPPLVDPSHVPVSRSASFVDANELVLGLRLNGEARAYPLNQLTGPRREIVNDTLGNRAIAATW